ncbi:helix-turn-helix domain-containing protein [Mycobacteroides abscessus]|uniref:helix-turn-helix domain-containing protein n=1 Tax=Mycobacteroides abscessus TaxID=36809 RepID=UPI00092B1E92|nr:helix-turn-helix transcriptional regulator [Mycobacteroides abscessus]DAZ90290.1 TPA_asm: Cro (control of repressor's operator) [Mycobacterium phage prophiFSQJ01-1]SII40077.1 Uncharacterised protein [Mycobacteroides abscessus subsp. abscessus]SIK15262.1 Uncharacterised protein [Mycobacteroides abscessus subsp. abscessus]SIN24700.1 Uncharacterised protein [Mycobacteroides abscessus subsp. abscessus]SLI52186.1 Uncharacterised protein [Mycobacteroides abscessus subsp. abscessus]
MGRNVTSVQVKDLGLLRHLVGPEPGKVMSATTLARRIGRHRSFVGHLLSGDPDRCRTFSVEVAQAISVALGVKMSLLFQPAISTSRPINVYHEAG